MDHREKHPPQSAGFRYPALHALKYRGWEAHHSYIRSLLAFDVNGDTVCIWEGIGDQFKLLAAETNPLASCISEAFYVGTDFINLIRLAVTRRRFVYFRCCHVRRDFRMQRPYGFSCASGCP